MLMSANSLELNLGVYKLNGFTKALQSKDKSLYKHGKGGQNAQFFRSFPRAENFYYCSNRRWPFKPNHEQINFPLYDNGKYIPLL